jgi:hypothetical protein
MSQLETVFYTWIRDVSQLEPARVLVRSLREFGGELRDESVWVFLVDPIEIAPDYFTDHGVEIIPIRIPSNLKQYYYGDKVYISARAEELAGPHVESLTLLAVENLIIQPPSLFAVQGSFDAAVRPVHIKNVGISITDAPDMYWRGVYEVVGIDDVSSKVESFIEGETIRAYFNSAAFSIRPAIGILRRWLECFLILVSDKAFQANNCQDEKHKIFLHQAVLSTLITSQLDEDGICILPPEYIYPYNLHESVPPHRRAKSLNELVSIYYGSRTVNPGQLLDIDVYNPLRTWLEVETRA